MRGEARAHPLQRLLAAIHREWAWLCGGLLVTAAALAAILVLAHYEDSFQVRAASAAAAELAASRVNALEWQSIAEGQVRPGTGARVSELLGTADRNLGMAGTGSAARQALRRYAAATRAEFGLLAAGRITAARRLDAAAVDPAYRQLSVVLERATAANRQAASRAGGLAEIGDIAAFIVGVGGAAALLLRFGTPRRARATAAVEQRLLRANDQAKNDLISVVSHDLRTPLTSIVGYLEMLADGDLGPISDEQRGFLDIVLRNTGRLQAIVNDLLFISRIRVGRLELSREELSLEEAAADAIDAQQLNAARKGIRLSLDATAAPCVLADRHRIDEVLENLLSNALKFTPPGGSVEVAVRPADSHVRLEVSDTGTGISPQEQEHVFEEFFRGREVIGTPGVGLGLSIVKAIADAHHAPVSIHSIPGEGTTFGLDVPVGSPVAVQPAGGVP